jgi:hypothetical protein
MIILYAFLTLAIGCSLGQVLAISGRRAIINTVQFMPLSGSFQSLKSGYQKDCSVAKRRHNLTAYSKTLLIQYSRTNKSIKLTRIVNYPTEELTNFSKCIT